MHERNVDEWRAQVEIVSHAMRAKGKCGAVQLRGDKPHLCSREARNCKGNHECFCGERFRTVRLEA